MNTCKTEGCQRPAKVRGWCQSHYHAAWRNGLPTVQVKYATDEDRFWSKVDKTKTCWLWTGAPSGGTGYGTFTIGGRASRKTLLAHRYSYELANGPIPAGLVIDHLCRVRLCINPAHLEAVTSGENNMRGEAPSFKLARADVCHLGHPLTGENVWFRKDKPNQRVCRTCSRRRQLARLERISGQEAS